MFHLLNIPAAEAAWAQCAKTPRDPDRRSPCPPHLLPLPSILHKITENKKSQFEITVTKGKRASKLLGMYFWLVSYTNGKAQKWAGKVSLIQTWYEPLLPSVMRSCSPFSTRVRLPMATLSCMTLRWWSVLSMGSWCWDSNTQTRWTLTLTALTHRIICNMSSIGDWLNSAERPTSDSYSLVNSMKLGVRMPFWYPWMTDGCCETSHNPSC